MELLVDVGGKAKRRIDMSRLLFFILLFSEVIAQEMNCTDVLNKNNTGNSNWHNRMIENVLDNGGHEGRNRNKLDEYLKKYVNNHVEYDSCVGQEEMNEIVDNKYQVLKEEHSRILLILIITSAMTAFLSIAAISAVIYLNHKILKIQTTKQQHDIVKETNSNGNSLQTDEIQVPPQELAGSRVNLVTSTC